MSQRYIGGLIYNPPGGFSGYFDGSGDDLRVASNAAFALGTGDFTFEMWINPPSWAAGAPIFVVSGTGGLWIGKNSSNFVVRAFGVADQLQYATMPPTNTWTHIVAVRSGTTLSLYYNGVRVATTTNSYNFAQAAAAVGSDGDPTSPTYYTGYISNLRLVKGTAVYDPTQTTITVPSGPLQAITNTSLLTCAYPTFRDGSSNNFTITVNGNTAVSTQNPFPLTQLPNPALGNQGNGVYSMSQYQALRSQNLWPAIDPYFDYVTLMLHGNGTNGAQNNTFLDSSTNNFTITRNGNTTQGTFTPYGSNWSNYTAGSPSGASRVDVSGASGIFGTNISYTMEGWFLFTTNSAGDAPNFITINTNTFPSRWLWDADITGGNLTMRLYTESNAVIFNSTATPYALGTWVHLAVVNNNAANTCTFYMNGVAIGSRAKVSLTAASTLNLLCNSTSVSSAIPFYVSNFRIVNNVALYTSNFTPSTSPLTAVSGTALLAFQSNRFIDTSGSNLTLTVNGTNQIQRFSPFAPTTPYAAGTIGGSGYFDGSGDWLNTSSSLSLSSGTDFTLEFWLYPFAAFAGNKGLVACGSTRFGLITEGGSIYFLSNSTEFDSNVNPIPGAWNHIALTRTNGTIRLFLNGAQIATASSNTDSFSLQQFRIGNNSSGEVIPQSYISDVRWATTSFYSSNFTPPTAPLAAVTNTQLLLSYTNSGIIDNAMMNDLETVGNAQISTSVSKFGGGSLAFDGSGDYLSTVDKPIFALGSGEFTMEAWVYPTALPGSNGAAYILAQLDNAQSASNQAFQFFIFNSAGTLQLYATLVSGSTGYNLAGNFAFSTNTWYHVAFTRASGGVTRLFVNGNQVGSNGSANVSVNDSSTNLTVGCRLNGGAAQGEFSGYIDELRVTNGYARYTANFTPQRSQWQDQ